MSVSLIVPYRPADERRERLWGWARRYWEAHWPEFQIIEADSGDEPFTRGRSVNLGAEVAVGDTLVIADADTVVSILPYEWPYTGDWVISYAQGRYLSLSETYTEKILGSDPARQLAEPSHSDLRWRPITSFSGCVIVGRDAFDRVGGYDPRFLGWGYEDDAFHYCLDTLLRPHLRSAGFAAHLYHPHVETQRFEQPNIAANRALSDRYRDAAGNPSAMRSIIRERS